MKTDSIEGSAQPSIILIPGLGDAGVGLPQLSDEGEYPQPICHHHQCISLGRALFNVDEFTRPIYRPDHQGGPVAVAV